MSNAGQDINEFCLALLGGPDGNGDDRLAGHSVCVWTLPDKKTRWMKAEVPSSIASSLVEATSRQPSAVHAVYIGLGFVPNEIVERKEAANKGQRAEAGDIAGIPGLWADIDIAGHGHKKSGLPPDRDAALSIVAAVGLAPTVVLDTGHGIQVWWALAEPLLFEDDAERDDVADVVRGWNLTLKARAAAMGGWAAGVDSVFNLDRLMRAPGSVNTKGLDGRHGGPVADHRPVRVLEMNPENRYELDHFRDLLAPDEELRAVSVSRSVSGAAATALPDVDLDAVWSRATSRMSRERDYTPDFIALAIDADPSGKLALTWNNQRPDLNNDQNRFDAALVRLLSQFTPAEQVEAVMCRRLKMGVGVDKVDPSKRTDYLARTVLNVAAMAATANATRDAVAADLAATQDLPVLLATKEKPAVTPATPVPEPEPHTLTLVTENRAPVRPRPELVTVAKDDPWGARHPRTEKILATLDMLLIPEKYREVGVSIHGLEHRDYGEAQRGRLVVKVPDNFLWPGGGPALYRVGQPLKAEWYRKDVFEVPKGYRMSLERDAMIQALPVGKNKEEWEATISALVEHWQKDSSGSDLATTATGWLLEYLTTHPATTDEMEAVNYKRAFLVDARDWGRGGNPPRILILFSAFVEFTAAKPGGVGGRNGRSLLSYLHIRETRPRLAGPDGVVKRRSGWYEVDASQFGMDEWGHILEVAHQQMTAREERSLRLMQGGQA